MNHDDNHEVLDIVTRTLDKLERKVAVSARRACRTALIQLAPKHLILPSPALGLMAFHSSETVPLPQGTIFRSLESLLPEGEVQLAMAASGAMLHPWRVSEASWLRAAEQPSNDEPPRPDLLVGCLITLQRNNDTTATSGWLSLHIGGGEILRWALDQCLVFSDNLPLPSCSWDLSKHGPNDLPMGSSAARDGLAALGRNLLQVKLPDHVCMAEKIQLVCRFRNPVPQDETTQKCQAMTNVFPVWNSLEARYPALGAVEQAVSANVHRLIHPLIAEDLGPSWNLWHLSEVIGSGGIKFPEWRPGPMNDACSDNCSFRFAMVHGETSRQHLEPFSTNELVPAIVLNEVARETLDSQEQTLNAAFHATQGTRVNGILSGTEFQVLPAFSPVQTGRIHGHLVGETWGGSDGCLGSAEGNDEMNDMIALSRYGSEPEIQDVVHLLQHNFKHILELVDESDLLAWSPGQLSIRFRFLRNNLTSGERAAIQESLHAFLSRYLRGYLPQGFQLLPVEETEVKHVHAG